MRKAFLVVALIGSSFAGGAAVNGPGLAWVKGLIAPAAEALESLDDESPDDEGAGKPAIADPPAARKAGATGRPASDRDRPTTDPAPAPVETRSSGPTPAPSSAPAPAASARAPAAGGAPAPAQGLLGSLQAALTPAPAPAAAPASAAAAGGLPPPKLEPPGGPAARPDPVVTPAAVAAEAAARPAERAGAPAAAAPAPASGGGVSGWLPPSIGKALGGGGAAPAADPAPAGTRNAGGSDAWAEIQRRMSVHGVTRYWIEGDAAAGTVRFRCVLPLAGRAAVAQQFEGEGDDLHAAAAAALRRIDLWKATEQP